MNFLNKSLAKKIFSNHFLKLLAGGINFLMIALIAKVTNSDILGEFTTFYAAIVLVSSLAFWGLADGFILLSKKFEMNILVANCTAIIIVNWVLSGIIVLVLFWNYELAIRLLMISIVFSFLIHNLFSALLRQIEKYKSSIYFNAIEVNAIFLFSILVCTLFGIDLNINSILLIYSGSHILSVIGCLIYGIAMGVLQIEFFYLNLLSKKFIFSIYKENVPLLISDILNNFVGTIDILILNRFLSFSDIASYKVASTLGKLIKISLSSFSNFMLPELSKLVVTSAKGVHEYIMNNYKYILIISIGFILMITLFGHFIIDIFFGEEYQISYYLLLILLIGYSFNNLSGPNGTILLALGKLKTLLKIDLITNLIGIFSLYFLTLRFGLFGSIVANVIILVIYNVLKNFYASKYLNSYKQVVKTIWISWGIASIFILIVFYLKFE